MLAIIKDISLYGIGDLLSRGINFLAIILYTHFLSQKEIGAYGYIMTVISFLTSFITLV